MLDIKDFVDEKEGQIFVNSQFCDTQGDVLRRAARVSLSRGKPVNYQIIKTDDYRKLSVCEAVEIMTPRKWAEELTGSAYLTFSLSEEEKSKFTKSDKRLIIFELKKQRKEEHRRCLNKDADIRKVIKILGL